MKEDFDDLLWRAKDEFMDQVHEWGFWLIMVTMAALNVYLVTMFVFESSPYPALFQLAAQ